MKRSLRMLLLLSAIAGLGLVLWRSGDRTSWNEAKRPMPMRRDGIETKAVKAGGARVENGPAAPRATRAETANYLKTMYRRELLTRELELEQQRYGARYWEAECDGVQQRAIEAARAALVSQLVAEANAVLVEFFPDEPGAPVELEAFFSADHAGPNVSGLSAASRERLEAAFAEDDRIFSGEGLFSVEEAETYARWNSLEARLLRGSLVGFDASQAEFDALAREWRRALQSMNSDGSTQTDIGTLLARTLTPQRAAELGKVYEPAMATALHDLRRNGLPLGQAEWLAAKREEAGRAIEQTRADATLTELAKQQKVAAIELDYGQIIAARLGMPGASLDELVPPTK